MGGRLRVAGTCAELRLLLHATRLDRRLELVDAVEPAVEDDAWHAPDDWTEYPPTREHPAEAGDTRS
jgi:hypothetical protein